MNFQHLNPIGIRFDWPIHVIDDSLKDAQVDGDLKKKINDQEIYDSFLNFKRWGCESKPILERF